MASSKYHKRYDGKEWEKSECDNWREKKEDIDNKKWTKIWNEREMTRKQLVNLAVTERKLLPLVCPYIESPLIKEQTTCIINFDNLFFKCWSHVGFNKQYFYPLLNYLLKKRIISGDEHRITHTNELINILKTTIQNIVIYKKELKKKDTSILMMQKRVNKEEIQKKRYSSMKK